MRPNILCELINSPFGDPVLYADIMFERRALLFDIGDISNLSARKLMRVSHVFVSHAHMDHFADFDRLLRVLLGRDKTIRLYGPAGFIDRVEHKLHGYTWNLIHKYDGNLVFDVFEVHGDGALRQARFESRGVFHREAMMEDAPPDSALVVCGSSIVRCAVLDHSTPCLGFVVEEPVHVNVWKTELDKRGLQVGPWLRALKRAIADCMPDSTPIEVLDKSGEHGVRGLGTLRDIVRKVRGQKIAYIVDVSGHEENIARVERFVAGADVLFIECAFLQADIDQAARKNHLTAWQSGNLARRARVKRLVPCHFSTRYTDRADELLKEAERAFEGTSANQ